MINNKSAIKLSAIILLAATFLYSFVEDEPKKPDESRFTPVVLTNPGDLDEPNTFEVLKDGRVLISERKGALKMYDPLTKNTRLITNIAVNTKYTNLKGVVTEAEEGFLGMTVDPNFEKNHWIYTFYSHPSENKFQLSRWELLDNELVSGSEKVVLEFPTQRETCCHTGGGMTWDSKGNLYITIGNNTGTSLSSSTDERPNRVNWDDQRGTANTNSLIGKILRIHPEPNGSYTIPKGNLFAKGTPLTRPEIYTMGHRNPWRPSIDSQTGFLYWGDIGSDANEDTDIGPRGYDELNQARKPGFFGWPYFVGPNAAFPYFDYVAGELLDKKDPKNPINNSVNNTGLKELPPVASPFIYYPYAVSEDFPLLGSGSRSATGGPVYRRADFPNAKRPWPSYYEGKWIATDLARGWIMSISMSTNGNYKSMERFLPSYQPVEPIDMKFGPDGDLYVLEYGSVWFGKSASAKLVKIEYNSGNRKPFVNASANKSGGTIPLKVTLSSKGTQDADGDVLKYQWKITSPGVAPKVFTTANPVATFDKPGVYIANLTVTDPKGASNTKSVKIIAGNETPIVKINLPGNNTFFFSNKPIDYNVSVTDKEDGSLEAGTISAGQVAVSFDYASEGFDYAEIIQGQRSVDASTQFAVARAIMSKSDCKNCHNADSKNIGPSFIQIAEKYKAAPETEMNRLVKTIRGGGIGVWGNTIGMPAHPSISVGDAHTIMKYIMNIGNKTINTLPVNGSYQVKVPEGDNGKGKYVVRAAYTDKGNKTVPNQTSEATIILRNPQVSPSSAEIINNAAVKINGQDGTINVIPNNNGYIGFKKIDLTDIKQLELGVTTSLRENNPGGMIEVRLDSPTGELVGQTEVPSVTDSPRNANTPPLKTDIKTTSGLHDVYLIFKNAQAKSIEPLMSLNNIRFINEKN
ncbi:MAG TPA: PQQ-dependent sugar dehydrogenase [Sphingobacteriaceae bacterium]|nr:PQQ-dependent sugar dehydrogenase [Sphingobacteriaceae bacterium]